jgi:hypothetical protein
MFLGCGHPTMDYHTVDFDNPHCNMLGMNCVVWRMALLADSHMRCQACEDVLQEYLFFNKLNDGTTADEKKVKRDLSVGGEIQGGIKKTKGETKEEAKEKAEEKEEKKWGRGASTHK